MVKIGEYIDAPALVNIAGVKNIYGTQCGILVNDTTKSTILIPKLPGKIRIQNYPNQWDSKIIGLLHFCGTNKGQTKVQSIQNMESKLNKSVNESTFPITVYVSYPENRYRYMGEFIRVSKYDEWIDLGGKKVIVFGLVSKNIEATEMIIKEMLAGDM